MTGPERIWIEGEEGCPYFYDASELSEASGPLVGYVRTDLHDEVRRRLEIALDDLEAYVRAEYGWPDVHPANQARFDRDMAEIAEGRAALARTGEG